jgi:hypothetical protein
MFLVPALLAASLSTASPLPQLAWLQGCWAADNAEPGTVEQWSSPAGGTMFGFSRTIKQGKTVEYEFVQIREVEPGKLAYLAQPSGQPSAALTLLRHSDTEFVFENLAHDFPQRVIYRRDGERTLRARIEGMSKGKLKGIDFPMKRISCDAP